MRRFIIMGMSSFVLLVLTCFTSITFGANNLIYITQSGTALTMNIDQIGNSNTVGSAQTRAKPITAVLQSIRQAIAMLLPLLVVPLEI